METFIAIVKNKRSRGMKDAIFVVVEKDLESAKQALEKNPTFKLELNTCKAKMKDVVFHKTSTSVGVLLIQESSVM